MSDFQYLDPLVGEDEDDFKPVDMNTIDPEKDYRNRDAFVDDKHYREATQRATFERLAREEVAEQSLPWAISRQENTLLDNAIQTLFMVVGTLVFLAYLKVVLSPRTHRVTRGVLLFIPIAASGLLVFLLLLGDKPKTIRFQGETVHLLGPANDTSLRVYGVCSPTVSKYHLDRMRMSGFTDVSAWAPRRDAWSIYLIGTDRFRAIGSISGSKSLKLQYVCDAKMRADDSINVISVFPVAKDSEDLADFQPIIDYFVEHPDRAIPWQR